MQDDEIIQFVEDQSTRLGIDVPTVTFRKMKHTFGVAHLFSWRINLNKTWSHKAHPAVVKDTILHELIHLKNYWVYGKGDHGKEFKEMCREFGCHENSLFTKKKQKEIIAASYGEK